MSIDEKSSNRAQSPSQTLISEVENQNWKVWCSQMWTHKLLNKNRIFGGSSRKPPILPDQSKELKRDLLLSVGIRNESQISVSSDK